MVTKAVCKMFVVDFGERKNALEPSKVLKKLFLGMSKFTIKHNELKSKLKEYEWLK